MRTINPKNDLFTPVIATEFRGLGRDTNIYAVDHFAFGRCYEVQSLFTAFGQQAKVARYDPVVRYMKGSNLNPAFSLLEHERTNLRLHMPERGKGNYSRTVLTSSGFIRWIEQSKHPICEELRRHIDQHLNGWETIKGTLFVLSNIARDPEWRLRVVEEIKMLERLGYSLPTASVHLKLSGTT